jgi:hypothetical protein
MVTPATGSGFPLVMAGWSSVTADVEFVFWLSQAVELRSRTSSSVREEREIFMVVSFDVLL